MGSRAPTERKHYGRLSEKGAKSVAPERGVRYLAEVQRRNKDVEFLIAPGKMGENVADQLKLEHELVGRIRRTTTSKDSVRIARLMKRRRADLIVFCGGDGTARDVLTGVGPNTPVLGVPAGVKIYSSVFAINPVAAAESTVAFLEGHIPKRLGEVVDVDEVAFRENRLPVKLFGHLTTPDSGPRVDMDDTALLGLVGKSLTRIVVSPIGGQGFLFGRGNKQITPEIIRRVGIENIIVVGSRNKIEALHPRRLLTDSGDDEIDRQLRGYLRVITGYREEMVVRVE